jgi:hypothetical protein
MLEQIAIIGSGIWLSTILPFGIAWIIIAAKGMDAHL